MLKRTIWILEEDLSRQFLLAEMLEKDFSCIFFETVSCIQNYCLSNIKGEKPALLIADLLTAEQGLRSLYLESLCVSSAPLLLLQSKGMPNYMADKYRPFAKHILFYPYTQSNVIEAAHHLTIQDEGELDGSNVFSLSTQHQRRLKKPLQFLPLTH